jgi:hypothetical protein
MDGSWEIWTGQARGCSTNQSWPASAICTRRRSASCGNVPWTPVSEVDVSEPVALARTLLLAHASLCAEHHRRADPRPPHLGPRAHRQGCFRCGRPVRHAVDRRPTWGPLRRSDRDALQRPARRHARRRTAGPATGAGPRPPRSKRRRANVDDRPDHSRSTPTGKRNNPVAWHQIHRLALRHTGKGVIQSCVTTGLVGWLSTNGSRGRRWRIPDNHRTPGVPSTSPARAERLTTLRRIAGGSFIILAKVPTQMHVHGLPSVVCCSLRTRSRRPG